MDLNFNFNCDFNFAVFSEQTVTVIVLTLRFTTVTTTDVHSAAYNGQRTTDNFSERVSAPDAADDNHRNALSNSGQRRKSALESVVNKLVNI
jgi:hypothetical protein